MKFEDYYNGENLDEGIKETLFATLLLATAVFAGENKRTIKMPDAIVKTWQKVKNVEIEEFKNSVDKIGERGIDIVKNSGNDVEKGVADFVDQLKGHVDEVKDDVKISDEDVKRFNEKIKQSSGKISDAAIDIIKGSKEQPKEDPKEIEVIKQPKPEPRTFKI